MTGVWAVVPVKGFDRAKSRLGASLPDHARVALARALCAHTLDTLATSRAVDGVLVATDSPEVERFVHERGAEALRDAAVAPLSEIIDRALAHLAGRADAALVLMADLPLLTPDDVRPLVGALEEAPLVLAPDRHDRGTNALAVRAPDRLATCFGSEVSFPRHLARARALAIPAAIHRSPGVLFDLDSPEDLARVRAYMDRISRVRAA